MSSKREEKALFEFKHIMTDLMQLVGKSTNTQTGYMYWVNRSRRQFVLETTYTVLSNVMFKDRIAFNRFFLDQYKDIKEVVQLKIGRDIPREDLLHYYNSSPTNYLTLIPFENNNSTVALTVLETETRLDLIELEASISAYKNAHMNVLHTYLELTDLYDDQNKWVEYEKSTDRIKRKLSKVKILEVMAEEMQKLLSTGGVSVVLRGMETWVNVIRSSDSPKSPELGLMVEDKSMAYDALQRGEALFSIHFNQNPKRISPSESDTEGATLAIPILISEKRCAVVLAFDKNPLIFKESTKYQLKNLVKIASLTLQSHLKNSEFDQNILATEYGNFQSELMNLCIKKEMEARSKKQHTWFGLIGIENLSELRSRFRLEDLKKLQRLMVKALNPARLGFNGLIGFHSDYVYSYILVSTEENHHEQWLNRIKNDLKDKLDLGDGRKVEVLIQNGSHKVGPNSVLAENYWRDVKHDLNTAIKSPNASISGM